MLEDLDILKDFLEPFLLQSNWLEDAKEKYRAATLGRMQPNRSMLHLEWGRDWPIL